MQGSELHSFHFFHFGLLDANRHLCGQRCKQFLPGVSARLVERRLLVHFAGKLVKKAFAEQLNNFWVGLRKN